MNAECAAHLNTLTFVPELVKFKDDAFVASHVDVGSILVNKGKVILSQITLGERSMLGNHSWLSPGATVGHSALIGAYTVNASMNVPDGTTWFGAPAIELPKRFVDDSSAGAYDPTCGQKLKRAVTEFFNAMTDAVLMSGIWFYYGLVLTCTLLYLEPKWWAVAYVGAPIVLWLICISTVKCCKCLLIRGPGTSRMLPLWGQPLNLMMWFKRCEDILDRDIVHQMSGTPYAGSILRLLGAKVGKHCFLHGMWACEWDMFTCGDNASIHYCDLQTHLFEDRVFKCNPVKLGHDVTFMPLSLALPNTHVEDGVTIGAKSCVMQGETVPADTHWQGAPMSMIKKQAAAPVTAKNSAAVALTSRRLMTQRTARTARGIKSSRGIKSGRRVVPNNTTSGNNQMEISDSLISSKLMPIEV